MIVVNQARDGFVNIDNVTEVSVRSNSDRTSQVVAKFNDYVAILGVYQSELRAEQSIRNIVDNMRKGQDFYEMPKSPN